MASLQERFWAKVDKIGDCWVWTAAKTAAGYGLITLGKRGEGREYAHRLSYRWAFGEISEGMEIDHACRNRACVNPSHLREVTRSQNTQNRAAGRGVTYSKSRGKWIAQVGDRYQNIYLGAYTTREEAAEAARMARLKLQTHNDMDRTA